MDESQVELSELMCRQIRVLVGLIGLPETLKLLEALGGTPVNIPLLACKATRLKAILSSDSIEKLCEKLGGQRLELPKNDKIMQQLRNHAIRRLRGRKSAPQLAREFNLTRRMIIYISQQAVDTRQVDLFDDSV